ncbi:hypothetical protein A3709_10940 [Halioglobus sp. HI00S01]|uniref:glycosyltransferase n=1 Tax=Halioglobus sp. HI00S01 TaxID=1822214 RepID=UPI0007C27011|nr:glycosyltransferase [Halioglobus sp. HI00S01]KZX51326.1 hypothetical protein A3709_10940 [Halioglobus sp. HI00S01]
MILWLCKARYMNHDVAADRYARLFELPQRMSEDASLQAVCLDYRVSGSAPVPQDLTANWRQLNLPRSLMLGWVLQLFLLARKLSPKVVIASSDCICVIIGYWLARVTGARFYADLYDDYSTFGLAKFPGIRPLYRRALAGAAGLSAVSSTLAEDLRKAYPEKPVLLLESTVSEGVFRPLDAAESCERLGLQGVVGSKLVGICGGLNSLHGADTVFAAIREFARRDLEVTFVVAGRLSDECPLPETSNVLYLGSLPFDEMPTFYNAMDLMVISLSSTQFGYYAFPQKAYEVLSCGVPAVAANVGALGQLFEDLPQARYEPSSPEDLADKIADQLVHQRQLQVPIPTWGDQAKELLGFVAD